MNKTRKSLWFGALISLAIGVSVSAFALTAYVIQVAHNDELFIINDEKFEAKLYCLGWERGERVIFIEGSPHGVCVSATLYNIDREEKCEVWCE